MSDQHTAVVVQRYLDELAQDSPSEPIIRALLDQSVGGSTCCASPCWRTQARQWLRVDLDAWAKKWRADGRSRQGR